MQYRIERDSIGSREIPKDVYYGIQTLRAMENFKITGIPISSRPKFIRALASIKQAAALANLELGLIDKDKANAIIEASNEILEGKLHDQFPVDMIQGGAGTSSNMNANEVICNRALEILGYKKGYYEHLHPNNHVNLSQSTNDVYPTAIKIAIVWAGEEFIDSIESLEKIFYKKAEEFKDVLKIGRTQLQDAVPMTLGQEFHAFGVAIGSNLERLREIFQYNYKINMGATAIGTGINSVPGYAEKVSAHLAKITDLPLSQSNDLIEATSDTDSFVVFSSVLKRIAIKLTKICNDLRLLSSGPQAGFHDINLPAVQPGSSIMPGKVNPVIPEVVNQVCFQVMGNDLAISLASSGAQMQLNAFEPVIAYNIFESMTLLRRGCAILEEKCVKGITANTEFCEEKVRNSAGLLTAFSPYIGYEEAATIAKKVQHSDKTVYELIQESGLLSNRDIEMILSPKAMTTPEEIHKDIVERVQKAKESKKKISDIKI